MGSSLYDGQISRLASEELAAIRTDDWSAAKRATVQKAALKEHVVCLLIAGLGAARDARVGAPTPQQEAG